MTATSSMLMSSGGSSRLYGDLLPASPASYAIHMVSALNSGVTGESSSPVAIR